MRLSPALQQNDTPTWDLLVEDFNSTPNGWTFHGTGTHEISPAGQLHVLPNASSYCYADKTVSGLATANQTTHEWSDYYDNIGTLASGNVHYYTFRDDRHIVDFTIASDQLIYTNGGGVAQLLRYVNIKPGAWYTWRLVCDSINHINSVFLKYSGIWYFIGTYSGLKGDAGSAGIVYAPQVYRGSSGSSEVHRDYNYIASGLYAPTVFTTLKNRNLDATVTLDISNYASLQMTMPPDGFSYDAETYPGIMTEYKTGAANVSQSSDYAYAGTYSIKLEGSGTDTCRLYKSVTPADFIDCVSARVFVPAITDVPADNVMRLFYEYFNGGGTPANERLANVGIINFLGALHPCLIIKIGTDTHVLRISDHVFTPATWNTVELVTSVTGSGATPGTWLIVNGIMVLDEDYWTFNTATEIGLGSRGGESVYPGTGLAYVDDLMFANSYMARISALCLTSNNKVAISASRRNTHNYDVTSKIAIFLGNIDGTGMEFKNYYDTVSYDDQPVGTVIADNGNIYVFGMRQSYTSGATEVRSSVWKSTDNGTTYSLAATDDTYIMQPSQIIVGGKIFCTGWKYPTAGNGGVMAGYLDEVWFDTATDTFDAPGARLETPGDITDTYGNESFADEDPATGDIVVFIRQHHMTDGAHNIYICYRRKHNGTWGALTSLYNEWGQVGGYLRAQYINGSLWIAAFRVHRDYSTIDHGWPIIMQVNPSTYEILDEWDFGLAVNSTMEASNGQIMVSAGSALYGVMSNGTLGFYRFDCSAFIAPDPPTGIGAIGGQNKVTVSFTPNGADSYNIYRGLAPGVTKLNGTKISDVTTPYDDTGLDPITTYYYVVTAMVGLGESVESEEVNATTDNPSPPTVSITSPVAGVTTDNTPLLTYIVDGVGSITEVVKVDGNVVPKVSGNNLDTLSDGLHTVSVEVSSIWGTGFDEVSFTVDTTPPSFTVDLSQGASLLSGTMDSGAIITVVPDGPATAGDMTYPTGTTWFCPISNLIYDSNTFMVFAEDALGNIASQTVDLAFGADVPGPDPNPGDSIRQQIITALDSRLRTILVLNGYKSNIGYQVVPWDTTPMDANVAAYRLEYRDPEDTQEYISVGQHYHQLKVEIRILFRDETPLENIREMIADVTQCIGLDVTWGSLAQDTNQDGNWVMDKNQASDTAAGASVKYVIEYTTEPWNPNQ